MRRLWWRHTAIGKAPLTAPSRWRCAATTAASSMRLSLFAATWGRTSIIRARGLGAHLTELRERGFAGLEMTAPELGAQWPDQLAAVRTLHAHGLRLIYSAYTTWEGYEGTHPGFTTPEHHLERLDRELECAAALEAAVPGVLAHVNIHGGCDSFDNREADEYYEGALARVDAFLADQPGLADGARRGATHETHRGRPLHHPTPTRRLLGLHGDRLRLTLDISHWHVASERVVGYATTTNRPDPLALGPANVPFGAEAAAAAMASPDALPPGLAAEQRMLHETIFPRVDHVHARIGTNQVRPHRPLRWRRRPTLAPHRCSVVRAEPCRSLACL
mmetsp:Transcript_17370/g.55350  ORF Transcript_17370/g.55350 Transcript_17370/m.55350 type:complete len:333 (+) Transcript_17370:1245-2243(+)